MSGGPKSNRFDVLGGAPERTAADRVLALLVDAIRAGVFEVGDKLPNLRDLSAELGASHIVVRRAVEVLVRSGVLEVLQGRSGGMFVTGLTGLGQALAHIYRVPDAEEAQELLEARFVVERGLVRRAALNRSASDLADLGGLLSRIERVAKFSEFTELTIRFHLRIALAARNSALTSSLREVLNRMALYGIVRIETVINEAEMLERGRPLYASFYEAMVHSDSAAAERCVDAHVKYVEDLYGLELASGFERGSSKTLDQ